MKPWRHLRRLLARLPIVGHWWPPLGNPIAPPPWTLGQRALFVLAYFCLMSQIRVVQFRRWLRRR